MDRPTAPGAGLPPSIGDRSVSCTQGQSVDAGPLTLSCSEVTADSVKLTAKLG